MLGKISRKKAEKIIGQTIRPDHAEKKMVVTEKQFNSFDKEKGVELTGQNKAGTKFCYYGFPHYTPKAKALKKAAKK